MLGIGTSSIQIISGIGGSVVNEVILEDGGEHCCPPCASLDGGFLIAWPQSKSHGASFAGSSFFATVCNCNIDQYFAINTLHLCTQNVAGKLQDFFVFHDGWFSGELSNHTTATEICPYMGRCCSWHTSGGVVLHPHQLAGGDVRGANQSHGDLPCWPSNHTTPSAASGACYKT